MHARPKNLILLAASVMLAACTAGKGSDEGAPPAAATPSGLVLTIERTETLSNGSRCILAVTVRNHLRTPALNVQTAWMTRTDGFGIISDYRMLGDFAAGEVRPLQLQVAGAPCASVSSMELTRAVCVVGPAADPPLSCADQVMLDGGGVIKVVKE